MHWLTGGSLCFCDDTTLGGGGGPGVVDTYSWLLCKSVKTLGVLTLTPLQLALWKRYAELLAVPDYCRFLHGSHTSGYYYILALIFQGIPKPDFLFFQSSPQGNQIVCTRQRRFFAESTVVRTTRRLLILRVRERADIALRKQEEVASLLRV